MSKNTGNLDVMAYLERINYNGPCEPNIDCLRQLHLAHLTAVPFENLSIHCGEGIVLDLPLVYDKYKLLSSIMVNASGTCLCHARPTRAIISKDHMFTSKVELFGYPSRSVLTSVDIDCLHQLHVAHLTSVPFENLSIHCGEDIALDLPLVYEKIVRRHRGGFCYELNHLFAWLLEQMGFSVTRISASVFNLFKQRYGPPEDHLLLLVTLTLGRHVLADVGFGSGFRLPLFLEEGRRDVQVNGTFQLRLDSGIWFMEQLNFTGMEPNTLGCVPQNEDVWVPRYKFDLTKKCWRDFSAMSIYQQVCPTTLFYCKSFCSKHLPDGAITYMGWRVISTTYEDGKALKTSRKIPEEEIPAFLKDTFGFTLPNKLVPKDEPIQLLPASTPTLSLTH